MKPELEELAQTTADSIYAQITKPGSAIIASNILGEVKLAVSRAHELSQNDARDWYAGQALMALIASGASDDAQPDRIATSAFNHADAMMAERKKRNTQTPLNPS